MQAQPFCTVPSFAVIPDCVVLKATSRYMFLCGEGFPHITRVISEAEFAVWHEAAQKAAGLGSKCYFILKRRVVPEEEYAVWAVRYEAAQKAMVDRVLALDAAAEAIERDLLLLGATAIEDKLQDVRPPHAPSSWKEHQSLPKHSRTHLECEHPGQCMRARWSSASTAGSPRKRAAAKPLLARGRQPECGSVWGVARQGVGACIEQLLAAGLRVWVLTGDKTETAVNIGYACCLLSNSQRRLLITSETPNCQAAEAAGYGRACEAVLKAEVGVAVTGRASMLPWLNK